jgi:RHS repeat-associated protein
VTRYYVYTASDERLGTVEVSPSGTRSDWTIRDAAGQVLRRVSKESNGEWKWQEDYIYRGTQMLAAEVPDSTRTHHFHLDHLGTPRLITGNGGVELSRHNYHPFGVEIAPVSTSATATTREKKQFTVHERDAESLDYMHARFYAPYMARFLSVDPVDGLQRIPQSWNRYAYALNNPLKYVDPTGMYVFAACSGDTKQCQANQKAFEAARKQELKSDDSARVAAAKAYGDPGKDNGVTVSFGTPRGSASTTPELRGNADGTMGMVASVVIKSGLRGTDLRGAVAHEGGHLVNAQAFVSSFSLNGTSWDISKNFTGFQTEMAAYRLTHAVYSGANQTFGGGCTGCDLGKGLKTQADVDLAITRLLANPKGLYGLTPTNQGPRQFPEWTAPPPPQP